MNGLGELAADLQRVAAEMPRAADGVIRAAGQRLEQRLQVAGDLASGVALSFPAPRTAVVGRTKRFGVYAEAGATPIRVSAADTARSADQVAGGLLAASARLLGGRG